MPTCRIGRERREQLLLDPTRHQGSGSAQPTVPRSEEDSLGLALSPRLVAYMYMSMYTLSEDRSLVARLGRPRARQAPLVVYVDPYAPLPASSGRAKRPHFAGAEGMQKDFLCAGACAVEVCLW